MRQRLNREQKSSQSEIHPSKGWLQRRSIHQDSETDNEMDTPAVYKGPGLNSSLGDKSEGSRNLPFVDYSHIKHDPSALIRERIQQRLSTPPIQGKLNIGKPNDKYEQEADRVASQVVEQINTPSLKQSPHRQSGEQTNENKGDQIQAKLTLKPVKAMAEGEFLSDLTSSINSARGRGQPLDKGLQKSIGQLMGADFSGVRVHTDTHSDHLNQSIQARAFTTGRDIFFKKGEYQPGSKQGQRLLAHELTHVVQQNAAINSPSNIIQASFLSFALKMGAKKASKGMLKNYIKTQIKQKIKKHLNQRIAKKFVKEADEILNVLNDPWWVTAIGFIPIAGDAFHLIHTPLQIKKAIEKADELKDKVDNLVKWQGKLKRTLKVADPSKVVNAISSFSGKQFKLGSDFLKLDKKGLKHILTRHHPDFWDGSVKARQSFLNPKMKIDDIVKAVESVLKQNQKRMPKTGLSTMTRQFEGVYNEVKYTIGINRGRVGQFYPM